MKKLNLINPWVKGGDEDYKNRIMKHRLRIIQCIVSVVILVIAVTAGIYGLKSLKHFHRAKVTASYTHNENVYAQYEYFKGNLLKFSKDGMTYYDKADKAIWTTGYEMQEPIIDICNDYFVVADKQGTEIYLGNEAGLVSSIDAGQKIEKVRVSGQGTVCVIVLDNETRYLKYYDSKGELIAEGKLQIDKSGYALDYDLSEDGKSLAVSYLTMDGGTANSNVVFYNFDSVGQNDIDNIVASFAYENVVIPTIRYFGNKEIVAVGDDGVYFFRGADKPDFKEKVDAEADIQSVFFSDDYIGLVADNTDGSSSRKVFVYKPSGSKSAEFGFDMQYDNVQFSGKNIIMNSESRVVIYRFSGKNRYDSETEKSVLDIIPCGGPVKYIYITENTVDFVEMK